MIVNVRHVDSRGVTRCVKLRFGVLQGLRFDVVIGLYAIALNFMDVMQDPIGTPRSPDSYTGHALWPTTTTPDDLTKLMQIYNIRDCR